MDVNCAHCIELGWGEKTPAGSLPHVVAFRMPDGSVHACPDMWIALRGDRIRRGGDVDLSEPLAEALRAGCMAEHVAMGQWAEMCGLVLAARATAEQE